MNPNDHSASGSNGADTTPRFIVGMARSGTQWLCKCLNEHPDAVAFGETMFWGRRYVEPDDSGAYTPQHIERIKRLLLSHGTCILAVAGDGPGCLKHVNKENIANLIEDAFSDLPDRPTPPGVFRALSRAMASAEGKSVVIEKTPHHVNWIDRILDAMPTARFVVTVREPYGFMLSYKHQGDRRIERVRRAFQKRYHPLACALVWRAYMRAALGAAQRHPQRTLLVRFSQLRDDAPGILDSVQEFFGLRRVDLSSAVPADNTSFPGPDRPQLRGEDYFWINLVAGRMIPRSGHELGKGPPEPLRVLWSIVRLPVWAVRNFFSLRQRISGSTPGYLWRWLRSAPSGT